MTPVNYTRLENHDERTIAHMAARARCDTLFGGALAMVYARRLKAMGSRNGLLGVVSDVYSASTGRHSVEYEAWECQECGQAHLGQDAAVECCAEREGL